MVRYTDEETAVADALAAADGRQGMVAVVILWPEGWEGFAWSRARLDELDHDDAIKVRIVRAGI